MTEKRKDFGITCIIVVMAVCLFLVSSCRTTKYVPVETKVTETVAYHDTTIVERLNVYHDTIAAPDTVSYLENEYAYSWARFQNGLLSHSLGTKEYAAVTVEVPKYIEKTVTKEIPQIVEVEKDLSNYQKFMIKAGEFLIVLVIASAIAYTVFKVIKRD
jgi:hypothetical protein